MPRRWIAQLRAGSDNCSGGDEIGMAQHQLQADSTGQRDASVEHRSGLEHLYSIGDGVGELAYAK